MDIDNSGRKCRERCQGHFFDSAATKNPFPLISISDDDGCCKNAKNPVISAASTSYNSDVIDQFLTGSSNVNFPVYR